MRLLFAAGRFGGARAYFRARVTFSRRPRRSCRHDGNAARRGGRATLTHKLNYSVVINSARENFVRELMRSFEWGLEGWGGNIVVREC